MLDVGERPRHVRIRVDAEHPDVLMSFACPPKVGVLGASLLKNVKNWEV